VMQDCYNANIYFLFLFDYGISQLFISSRNKIVTDKRYGLLRSYSNYMSITFSSYSCDGIATI